MTFLTEYTWSGELPQATNQGDVRFTGIIKDKKFRTNISGIASRDELLIIGADEGTQIQVLKRQDDGSFKGDPEHFISLKIHSTDDEVDIEGIAVGKEYVYIIGSHSRARKTIDASKREEKKNLKRLQQTESEPSREQLFRLNLNANGDLIKNSIKIVSLRNTILNDPVLAPFQVIPSKENGVDIEGIAADEDNKLYIGFRGPVLRGGFVPILILKVDFEAGDIDEDIVYVNLGGRGIRDMVKVDGVKDEFLIVAGPIGDEPTSYQIYRWNGKNTIPGTDKPDAENNVQAVCVIPPPSDSKDAKAEGITFISKEANTYRFMIIYDGPENGGATMFSCTA
jgi:hypothetical protein